MNERQIYSIDFRLQIMDHLSIGRFGRESLKGEEAFRKKTEEITVKCIHSKLTEKLYEYLYIF
ncbi:hypothetical protein GCM10009119_24480 [Algoriphagus jejuensis]|uniref:Uncharacterized protein n=1 Tax=Algoriphagus jejuensis TaxID=419934 RepID=A0ABN1N1R3_9BACT